MQIPSQEFLWHLFCYFKQPCDIMCQCVVSHIKIQDGLVFAVSAQAFTRRFHPCINFSLENHANSGYLSQLPEKDLKLQTPGRRSDGGAKDCDDVNVRLVSMATHQDCIRVYSSIAISTREDFSILFSCLY